MEGKCAVCRTNCGIGTIVTNNGESICSLCVEKCGGRKNSKIKVMSVPELKDIVREYNRNALEARSINTNNSNIDLQIKSILSKLKKVCIFFAMGMLSLSALFWTLLIMFLVMPFIFFFI